MGRHEVSVKHSGHTSTVDRGYIRIVVRRSETGVRIERWQHKGGGVYEEQSAVLIPSDIQDRVKEAIR